MTFTDRLHKKFNPIAKGKEWENLNDSEKEMFLECAAYSRLIDENGIKHAKQYAEGRLKDITNLFGDEKYKELPKRVRAIHTMAKWVLQKG